MLMLAVRPPGRAQQVGSNRHRRLTYFPPGRQRRLSLSDWKLWDPCFVLPNADWWFSRQAGKWLSAATLGQAPSEVQSKSALIHTSVKAATDREGEKKKKEREREKRKKQGQLVTSSGTTTHSWCWFFSTGIKGNKR